jgi:hypothetical protein
MIRVSNSISSEKAILKMETSVCPESFVIKRVLYVLTGKKQ